MKCKAELIDVCFDALVRSAIERRHEQYRFGVEHVAEEIALTTGNPVASATFTSIPGLNRVTKPPVSIRPATLCFLTNSRARATIRSSLPARSWEDSPSKP